MIDDMTARRFGEDTQKDYVRHVRNFTAFLGRSPDTATSEDLRRYQLHLAKQQISPGSINAAGTALRFFFKVTLERPDLVRHLRPYSGRAQPVVLSEEEVARLLEIRAQPQVQGRALRRLRRRPAGVRGREPQGIRYRRAAHDASGRARQGAARPLRDAFAATARVVARMVARRRPALPGQSRSTPCRPANRCAPSTRRRRQASPSACRRIPCGTASPPICSSRASIFA